MLRIFFGLLISLHAVWSETIIEYGGISFECEESLCAFPEHDRSAEALIRIYDRVLGDTGLEGGFLCDSMHKWRTFTPYRNDTVDYSSYVSIDRYSWEENGISDISGEYDSLERLFFPDSEYFVNEQFPINQTGMLEVFKRVRTDLEFYVDLRVKCFNRKIDQCNHRVALYRGYLASGFTHIAIENERATDPVRRSDFTEEEWEEGIYSELCDEIVFEENLTKKLREKIDAAARTARISLRWLDIAYKEIDPFLKEIFFWCLKNHQPEGIAFNGVVESLLVGDLPEALEYLRNLILIGKKTGFSEELMSKIYLLKGQLQSEFCLYGDAVLSLTEAIRKNPSYEEAYLERATAYFELGEFDQAVEDYLMLESFGSTCISDRSDFAIGFTLGAAGGFGEAVCSFLPRERSEKILLSLFGFF